MSVPPRCHFLIISLASWDLETNGDLIGKSRSFHLCTVLHWSLNARGDRTDFALIHDSKLLP